MHTVCICNIYIINKIARNQKVELQVLWIVGAVELLYLSLCAQQNIGHAYYQVVM